MTCSGKSSLAWGTGGGAWLAPEARQTGEGRASEPHPSVPNPCELHKDVSLINLCCPDAVPALGRCFGLLKDDRRLCEELPALSSPSDTAGGRCRPESPGYWTWHVCNRHVRGWGSSPRRASPLTVPRLYLQASRSSSRPRAHAVTAPSTPAAATCSSGNAMWLVHGMHPVVMLQGSSWWRGEQDAAPPRISPPGDASTCRTEGGRGRTPTATTAPYFRSVWKGGAVTRCASVQSAPVPVPHREPAVGERPVDHEPPLRTDGDTDWERTAGDACA